MDLFNTINNNLFTQVVHYHLNANFRSELRSIRNQTSFGRSLIVLVVFIELFAFVFMLHGDKYCLFIHF